MTNMLKGNKDMLKDNGKAFNCNKEILKHYITKMHKRKLLKCDGVH